MLSRVIHCYAEGREGAWEAVCLDFDLAVQGDSFEVVYRELNEGIEAYVQYVEALPADERADFYNRRVPFSLRIKFVWHALRGAFSGRGGKKARHDYTTPAPFCPA